MEIELSPQRSLVNSIQLTLQKKKERPFFKDLPVQGKVV